MNTFNLDNSIKVIVIPKTDTNISCVSVFVGVGSINETENIRGASHFLEHMLFKGTNKRPKSDDISKELDSVGAYFNAYTDKDLTSYIVKLNSDYLEKADILSDMLLNPIFEEKNFEIEKKLVVEELDKTKIIRYSKQKNYMKLFFKEIQRLFCDLMNNTY